MRVKIERFGGLTGEERVVAEYDTAELPEQEAAQVREAVESLAAAHARGTPYEIGADLPGYRITVDEPGNAAPRVHEVHGDIPAVLLVEGRPPTPPRGECP